MNVLVIGGGGYVGRIVQPALEAQHQVTYLDLKPVAGAEDRSIVGDLADQALVDRVVQGQDAIIFMAMGLAKRGDKWTCMALDPAFDVNVRDQYRVLDSGLKAGVKRFVLISSLSVYGGTKVDYARTEANDPPHGFDPYAITKRLAENLHQAAAEKYPDRTFLALRFMLPRSEEDFVPPHIFDPAKGMANTCALGPNDTRRLLLAAVACEKPGCYIMQTTGDLTGVRYPNTYATQILGWAPQGN